MEPRITFTLDVEDHRPHPEAELRFPMVTERVLDFLDTRGITATVFVVGNLVVDHPDLIRGIHERGHELGLHSWDHTPLPELDPVRFREDTRRGKEQLEDVTGTPVRGYRAPTFSLVPETAWVTELLHELGFEYSSSVLPARNPLYAWPDAPRGTFRWPSGLVEIPSPVAGLGTWGLPHLGGVYFRVLPGPLVRLADRLTQTPTLPFVYCHPYDFDPDEEYWVLPELGRLGSRLVWLRRRAMFDKLEKLFAAGAAPPFSERLRETDVESLPEFDPFGVRAGLVDHAG